MQHVSPLTFALEYARRGWFVVPLCWPVQGQCGCGRGEKHRGREGKVPLFRGYMDSRMDTAGIQRTWGQFPNANVGLLLEPSQLLVVDLDSEEASHEAQTKGLPPTFTVKTPSGMHHYYRRPDSATPRRITQYGESGKIDLLSNGYVVAAPSLHKSDAQYTVESYPPSPDELPSPPDWAMPPEGWKEATHKAKKRSLWLPMKPIAEGELRAALAYVSPDEYGTWLHVGFALKQWEETCHLFGCGFALWNEWSQRSAKYPGAKDMTTKWRSFKRDDITVGSLLYLAKEAGYQRGESEGGYKLSPWKAQVRDKIKGK